MISDLFISTLLSAYGIFFIVYAYREPPAWIASLFRVRVPILFGILLAFVPDQHTTKVGRIGLGSLLILGSLAFAFQAFYHFFFGWS